MKSRLSVAAGACIVLVACAKASALRPSTIPDGRLPASWGWEEQGFSVSIERQWHHEAERVLIERAEAVVPDSIRAAVRHELERRSQFSEAQRTEQLARFDALDTARVEPRWWYTQFDETLLPFAVTDAAVRYYSAHLAHLSRTRGGRGWQLIHGDSVLGHGTTRGHFKYSARVAPVQTEQGDRQIQVQLRLDFSFQCGLLCGLYFFKTRAVYFSEEGVLLRVEGDGVPSYLVS